MKTANALILAFGSLALVDHAAAHSRWMLPSHTMSSVKEPELVSFDLSVSNDIFHAERALGGNIPEPPVQAGKPGRPRPKVSLEAALPDGKSAKDIPITYAGRKSVASFELNQPGTYRFSVVGEPTKVTSFDGADGKKSRTFGEFTDAKKLPAGSKNVEYVETISRIDTYVTRTSTSPVKPYPVGLDLTITPHPNDLFVGETSEIQVLVNGKPAPKGVKLVLTPGNTRHRNERGTIELTTDDKGKASIKWPSAGFFLVEAEQSQPGDAKGTFTQRTSLSLTLEVNPS